MITPIKSVGTQKLISGIHEVVEADKGAKNSVQLQVAYKPQDVTKNFGGDCRLKHVVRPKMKICIVAAGKHADEAKKLKLPTISINDIKTMKKKKGEIQKLVKKYDAFIASEWIARQVPHWGGSAFRKAGKEPFICKMSTSLSKKLKEVRATVRVSRKNVKSSGCSLGTTGMPRNELIDNAMLALGFIVSQPANNWEDVTSVVIKTEQGKPVRLL